MNLRDIKKDIDYVLSAFVEDCATCVAVNPKANDEAIAALMEEAIDLYNELRDKAATKKVEGNKKAFYNSLRKEILERTDALYSKLSAVVAGKEAELKAPKAEPVKKAEEPAAEKPAAKKAPAKKAAPKAEKAEESAEEKKPAAKKPAAKKAAPKAEAEKPAAEKKPAAKKAPAKKAAPKAAEAEPKAE